VRARRFGFLVFEGEEKRRDVLGALLRPHPPRQTVV
jgi:hypothetical protein